jgi:hypothetical protein
METSKIRGKRRWATKKEETRKGGEKYKECSTRRLIRH